MRFISFSSTAARVTRRSRRTLGRWPVVLMRSKSLIFLLMLVALAAVVAPLAAKSGQNPSVAGDYDVVFKGAYEGQGTAKVNGSGKKIVWIKGDLKEVKHSVNGRF